MTSAALETPRPTLFASTRVVARPHIGTFFGWIKPIAVCARTHDVTVLLCDHQSFDGTSLPTAESVLKLKATLQAYFSEGVSIITESEIEGLEALLPLLLRLSSTRRLTRNPTLKALDARGALTLGHMVYPLLMAADLVAIQPDEIVANAHGFIYHEHPFALIKRMGAILGLGCQAPRVRPLPRVEIVDDFGERIRRSSNGPTIGDAPDDVAAVERWILGRATPTPGPAAQRWDVCLAPKSVWLQAPSASPPCNDPASIDCEGCLPRLCDAARAELAAFRRPTAKAEEHGSRTLSACKLRLDAIFQSWSPLSSATDACQVSAVAFVPLDVAGAELACWIALSFARRVRKRKGPAASTFDFVLMPPNDPKKIGESMASCSAQLEVLKIVARRHRIDCRVTTSYHALKPAGSLAARLYSEPVVTGASAAADGLRESVDRHHLAVLIDRYRHADQVHFIAGNPLVAHEGHEPLIMDGWRLLEPVSGRLDDQFDQVIRRYPSASSVASDGETISILHEIHTISTDWWDQRAAQAEALTRSSNIKDRIVQSFQRIWRV